jgi:hypothetical protein
MALDPNAAAVAKRLQTLGLSRAQIAGVLGNFQLESGFNPRINEGGRVGAPAGAGGFGLAQWTGGRQTGLINYAKKKGLDPGSIEAQADFLAYELQGPEKRAFESLKGAVSPEESARRFLVDFERAGVPKTEQRQKAARSIYEKLGNLDGMEAPQQASSSSSPDVQNFVKGFILKNLLGGDSSMMPSMSQQLLQSALQRPMTTLESDIATSSLYTPRTQFLESLTQF